MTNTTVPSQPNQTVSTSSTLNNTNPTQKRALVLGGGGSRGSYTMGVISALMEQNKTYGLVTGISIGALVGAVYAMNKPFHFQNLIDSFKSDSVAENLFSFPKRHEALLTKKGDFNSFIETFQTNGPSVAPLRENFSKLFDFDAFQSSPIDYACLAANLTQNKPALFTKKDMTSKDLAIDQILASAAYFPAFSFVKIGDDMYADGGYLNEDLGNEALDMGATDLTIVSLADPNAPLVYEEKNTSLLIRPILKLRYFLDFNKTTLVNQIEQGYLEALKFMNLAPGYLYTFYPEDGFLFEALSKTAQSVFKDLNVRVAAEEIVGGMTELLGYRPGELHNKFIENYLAGLLLECLGLIAGVNLYQRWHFSAFCNDLLTRLKTFTVDIPTDQTGDALAMEEFGARDMMAFFNEALKANGGKLPDGFDIVINKFKSLYYLAIAWVVLDKFSLLFKLF